MGLSFDSRIQMVGMLRLQRLNLGRPWVYDVIEEDISSAESEDRQHPVVSPRADIKEDRKGAKQLPARSQKGQAQQPAVTASSKTHPQPVREARKETKEATKQLKSEARQEPTGIRAAAKQTMNEWIVNIRSDGHVVFENVRGERYYFDENAGKVYVRRGR